MVPIQPRSDLEASMNLRRALTGNWPGESTASKPSFTKTTPSLSQPTCLRVLTAAAVAEGLRGNRGGGAPHQVSVAVAQSPGSISGKLTERVADRIVGAVQGHRCGTAHS